ncbi:microtubule-actin cross-linking factor 1-like isoform X6 [Lethenteron reissneri]|uniref:microtubule-actin cross-linking factor 1-like isoform X6 n=1 Tax=Lethenteron reissneri TaxID=7753 RepID=UPI002AB7D404|nr:microtubule-actin cross-linking factor 1-like isoform X6 [Lethenteron reissneri]
MTPPDHEVEKVNPQVRSPREAQGPVGPVGPVGPTDTGVGALGLAPSRVRRRRFAPRDRTYLAFHATASPDTKVSGRIFQRSMSSSDLGLFSDDDNAGLRSRRSHRDDDGEDGDDDDDEEEDDEDDRLSVKSDSLQWLQAGDTLPWNLPRHQRAKMRRPHESVLDPAERAVLRIADERDRVQKKTFTKWVNKHLMKARKHLNDLYEDLRDGHNLISLLEVLSNETLPREKGRMRFHRLQNVQIALDYLKHRKIKLVNIRNDDITDGNPKLTLGLIWTIILHFQISDIQVTGQSEDMTAKEKLLLWSKRMVDGYPGVKCDNFTTSWRDGKLFTAIIHKHKPELVDLKQVHGRSNQENLEFAFSTAERELGVTRLLDPEDVDVASPDEKSIITYVSSLYDAIPKAPDGANANEVETQWREYQELVVLLLQWLRHHVTVMYTRNFPNNPAELKALYNQYLQFKEMELPPKENDKMRIKTLYKSLEAWILAGRIKLPQGQHPNDVEKEWGRLIVAMLEREKELRPEIERLEMLQRVALQIQQESGVCEEKLMRAERLLHMELRAGGSAGPGATELEVTLGELDALIRSMFANVQTLKDGRYFQAENMYRRVFQLHERVVALRSEHRTAFSPSRVAGSAVETQTSRATLETQTTQTDRGQGKLQQQQQQQLQVKLKQPQPQQRRSPGGSTAEEEATVSLRDLLQWVEAQQVALDAAEWGTDLPAVEANLEAHRGTHRDIEAFRARLEQAKAAEPKVSSANRGTYSEYLGRLELQYTRLLNSSRGRLRHLESLERFVSRATHELMWLNAREEEEVAHDWSNRNPDVASKREYHEELMKELEKKEVELNTLRDGGEQLLVQNHPARETIEAYLAAIQSQWHWILQICSCVETHLKENTTFFQFFAEAREGEQHLNSLLESIQRKYTCDKSSSLSRLEDLVQCSMDEKEQLVEFKRTVAGLVGRAKTIVQLKPRNPENRVSGSIPIRAVCDYKQMEITIHKGEECALEDNSQRSKWRVINPTGNIATVPSVCFLVPPPNPDAMETAARIEQLYQSAMALWHQQHVNMKSVVSYLYLIKDIEIIRSWNVITLKSLPQQEYERVVRSLQVRFQDFLEDSRESQLISTADHARVQADVEACRQHFDALLSAMRQEEEGESLCGSLLSRLQKLRLRLEGCEERVIRQIRAPLDPSDPLQDSVQRVAEQEAVVQDLGKVEAEMSSLDKESREALSAQPGQSHSVSSLASELALTTQKLVQVKALSTVYLERLKRMSMLVGSLQEADVLLKELEGHLYEEETVPTDPATVSTYIVQLQAWAKEAEETEGRKGGPLASLDVQLRAARESGGRMLSEHGERDPDLERVAERAEHTLERWQSARAQIRARLKELEGLAKVLRSYRESAVWLEAWLDKTMKLQEKVQASKIEDVRGLEEQLEKQKALAMDIEKNQVKVDECQKYSEQYSLAAKDYELQLMTYKAMVDTHQRSPVKRRRLLSTSDSIMQEYMTLRTRYTALVTMTSQYVKFISETLQRLQGEQQSLAESQEEHLTRSERLVGWVQAMHRSLGEKQRRDSGEGGAGGEEGKREPSDAAELERSLKEQQSFAEELSGRKEEIAEAIQRSQTFLALCGDKLTPEQYQAVDSQTQQLKQAYEALCEQSSAYTQELHHSLQQENSIKVDDVISGVVDLCTMETFPIFHAMLKGLIDQETGLALLEAQVATSGIVDPRSSCRLHLDEALAEGLMDKNTAESLWELESALSRVHAAGLEDVGGLIFIAAALERGLMSEAIAVKLMEVQLTVVGPQNCTPVPEEFLRLQENWRMHTQPLIDPNTGEKLTLAELTGRAIADPETGLRLLPVTQTACGMISLKPGRRVSICRAVKEGLVDRQVTVRLLEAQLFAGGIVDPRTGHRLTVEKARRHGLIDREMANELVVRQTQAGGVIDPATGDRLDLEEAIASELISLKSALLVLEAHGTFRGFVWPGSVGTVPISEALEQGMMRVEVGHSALSKRHCVAGLFWMETAEAVSLKQSVASGICDEALCRTLSATHVPDSMGTRGTRTHANEGDEQIIGVHPSPSIPLCSKLCKVSHVSQMKGICAVQGDWVQVVGEHASTTEAHNLMGLEVELVEFIRGHSYINALTGDRLVMVDRDFHLLEGIAREICKMATAECEGADRYSTRSEAIVPDCEQISGREKKRDFYTCPQRDCAGYECDSFNVNISVDIFDMSMKSCNDDIRQDDVAGSLNAQQDCGGRVNGAERDGSIHEHFKIFIPEENAEPMSEVDCGRPNMRDQREGCAGTDEEATVSRNAETFCTVKREVKQELNYKTNLHNQSDFSESVMLENNSNLEFEEATCVALQTVKRASLKAIAEGVSLIQNEHSHEPQDRWPSYDDTCMDIPHDGVTCSLDIIGHAKPTESTSRTKEDEDQSRVDNGTSSVDMESNDSDSVESWDSQIYVLDQSRLDDASPVTNVAPCVHLSSLQSQATTGHCLRSPLNAEITTVQDLLNDRLISLENARDLLERQIQAGGIMDRSGKQLSLQEAEGACIVEPALATCLHVAFLAVQGFPDRSKGKISLFDAIRKGLVGAAEGTRLLRLQAESGGILDPSTGQRYGLGMAVDRGLVDTEAVMDVWMSQLRDRGAICDSVGGPWMTLDEAVDNGTLPMQAALKVYENLGLFGGFVDNHAQEFMTISEALEEGIFDAKLAQRVFKPEKIISGVIHPTTGRVLTVSDAVNTGLLDTETGLRILETQVCAGGVTDLRRKKKLSVTLAAKLGLVVGGAPGVEALMKLEKASRGKDVDAATRQKRASICMETEGLVDPQTKSVVTLPEAVDRGLLDKETAVLLLRKQIAHGGVVHHQSGMRLRLSDALARGLVDEDTVEELSWVEQACRQGFVHPETMEAVPLAHAREMKILDERAAEELEARLAECGAVFDFRSGRTVALKKAVSLGILSESAVVSAGGSWDVTHGLLDPDSCQIVSYASLVQKGKTDVRTGQRFLTTELWKGVENEETGDRMTLLEAVRAGQVDAVPALRALQAQADTGGIVDICSGERICIVDALKNGMLDAATTNAILENQLANGGIVDIWSGERMTLDEALVRGLLTRDIYQTLKAKSSSVSEKSDAASKSAQMPTNSSANNIQAVSEITHSENDPRKQNQSLAEKTHEQQCQSHPANDAVNPEIESISKQFSHGKENSALASATVISIEEAGGKRVRALHNHFTRGLHNDREVFEATEEMIDGNLDERAKSGTHGAGQGICGFASSDAETEVEGQEGKVKKVDSEESDADGDADVDYGARQGSGSDRANVDAVKRGRGRSPGQIAGEETNEMGMSQGMLEKAGNMNVTDGTEVGENLEHGRREIVDERMNEMRSSEGMQEKAETIAVNLIRSQKSQPKEALDRCDPVADSSKQHSLSKRQCLEHFENVMRLISLVLDVRVRQKSLQRSGSDVDIEDQLDRLRLFEEELSSLECEASRELEHVRTALCDASPAVPAELLQALGKDSANLSKCLRSARQASSAQREALTEGLRKAKELREQKATCPILTAEEVTERGHVHEEKLNVESKQEEFSRRLDELESWLAEAKGALASQPVSGELPDIQRQQEKHQALQRELMGRGAEVTATVCAVRDFLRENGARLDPEYVARTHERLSALGSLHEAATRLSGEAQQRLNEALGDVIKQQTEKVATEEQLEDIRGKTGALLQWLTELESRQQRTKEEEGEEMDGTRSPEMGSVGLSELLHQAKAEHQEVLSRQQAVIVATQLCQALLERHASRLAPDDAAQLRRACDELGLRYDAALSRCGARLRPLESASDALAKLDGDCAEFEAWLTNARDVLATSFAGSGGGGEEEVVAEDEDVLAARLRRQREFAEDVVSRRGDLRYLGVAARRATEASASAGPEVAAVCGAVQRRLEGMEARYSTLHVECVQLGSRFSEALGLRAEFQRASAELSERLRAAEGRNAGQAAEPAASEPAGLQSQLDQATALQGDVSTLQPMLEKLKRSTSSLLEVGEDLGVNRPAIEQALDELTARADCLRASAAGRSEQLRRAVARSLGAREGLDAAARWLAEAEREAAARTPPGPLSSAAVRDEVAKNEAMQQELASHQGALATIAERLGDPASAAEEPPGGGVLREDLAAVTRRFSKLSTQCQERKEKLLRLTEKVEEFEEGAVSLQRAITKDSQAFEKEANGPNADLEQIAKLLEESAGELANRRKALEGLRDLLAGDLADPSPFADTGGLARTLSVLGESCEVLERALHAREENLASCRQQMEQFQCAIAEVQAWLEEAESRVPSEQTTLSTDALQEQLNSVQTVLTEWEGKASAVRGVVERASETARARSSVTPPAHDAAPTPDVVEVRREALAVEARYSDLGVRLRERSGRLSGALARTSWVLEEADALLAWLEERAQLTAAWGPVPAEPDAVRAEADKHKAFQEDLEDKAPRIQKVTQLLSELLESSADDPDADALRKRLDTIERGWSEVRAGAEERARRLEESCGLHETFSAALAQLSPWLAEKRLMASVLGPLALDPNMLTNQRQQVQFMLREFETRKPQHEQLNRVARGILGDDTDSAKDGGSGEVEEEDEESKALLREQLASVNAAWDGLTGELHDRAQRVEDAVRESGRLATALAQLAEGTAALARGLEEGQPPVAATPDALVVQLRRAEETMAAVAALAPVAEEARERSEKLGDVVGEAYLQAELRRRLDVALQPFKELEERASKRLELVQEALQCSRKFSESLEELATWVTEMRAELARFPPVSIEHGSVQAQLERQEEFLGRVTAREGSFQTIVADGEVVAQAPPGPSGAEDVASLGGRLAELKARWEELTTEATARRKAIHRCAKKVQRFEELREEIIRRLTESEERLGQVGQVTLSLEELESRLAQTQGLRQDVEKLQGPLELLTSAGRDLAESCPADADFVEGQTADIGRRVDSAMGEVQTKLEVTEAVTKRLKRFTRGIRTVQEKLAESRRLLEMHRSLGAQAASNGGHLEKMRACRDGLHTALTKEAEDLRAVARELAELAPGDAAGAAELAGQAERLTGELAKAAAAVAESCDALEERARGIGRLRGVARDLFARLSDLSEELDSQGPPGRAPEALRSQLADIDRAAAAAGQLGRDIADAGLECRRLLEQEEAEGKAGKAGEQPGAGEVEQSVELQGMRRETEALQRQCARLGERAAARKEEARTALERVEEFYRSLRQVTGLLERAEEKEAAQGPVGTEIDLINQQMADFQAFQKSDVDSLQVEMQALNRQAQALIQSAAKSADTGALESDADETNSRWNTLNTKVAERAAKLQEALLHCGKFQEALESLLGWLADTEELIAGQKPPAAEYKVVRAQLQEQKLLQHLLDDHRPRVEVLRREGEQIAELAEPAERERILGELASLSHRWEALLAAAQERQRQLEAILSVARRFHDTLEPLLDWLTAVERRLSNAEPIGTQTVAIQEQIDQHKCVAEDIASRAKPLEEAQELSSALMGLSCSEDGQRLQAKLGVAQARHAEAQLRSERRAALLNEALENARIFGENEVALLTWLAQTQDRLAALRNILDYRPEPLQAQYDEHLILHEEIVSRKQDVDQAIKNGHALLKQTTGDDVLLIQEKLDGLRGRYGEVSASGARAQRALEKALGLAVRFHAARDELGQWLDATEEAIAAYDRDEEAGGEQLTTLQGRQQDLRKQVMERRVLLDTVNEVGTALLALVPWRARDGLDTAVAQDNERYAAVSDAVATRTRRVDAAIQRSQQFEQALDAERAWAAETLRKLEALGDIRLEPEQTMSQLQVQKAFTIDILRHKDSLEMLEQTMVEVGASCSEEENGALQAKLALLRGEFEATSGANAERLERLERAHTLASQFWETLEELEPWLGETRAVLAALGPPAVDPDSLRQQQDELRHLRETIAEHKPHVERLRKTGPRLAELSAGEGGAVRDKQASCEQLYSAIRDDVLQRARALDEAVELSSQFHEKIEPMLEALERISERLRSPPPVPAETEKLRDHLSDNRAVATELDKLEPSFKALRARGEELIARSLALDAPPPDGARQRTASVSSEEGFAARGVQERMDRLVFLWGDIAVRAEEREGHLLDVLELSERFWYDHAALAATLRDAHDALRDLDDPALDPSLIKLQQEAMQALKEDSDGLQAELDTLGGVGCELMAACGDPDKPEVKKSIDELNSLWETVNRTWRERMERLDDAMQATIQFQDALQGMFDWLDMAEAKLAAMPPVGTDLESVKRQMEELKAFKAEAYGQQMEMERLTHQGELLLRRCEDPPQQEVLRSPLVELRRRWDSLDGKIVTRQHKLEASLLALGQFQHALSEVLTWLGHTEQLLAEQRTASGDPRHIEIELAKHHVLRNDVLAHKSTVESVSEAGGRLVRQADGEEASALRGRLGNLGRRWEAVLKHTDERQRQLEAALKQAQGFQGEVQGLMSWLARLDGQMAMARPPGGLPETAREQLNAHLELCREMEAREAPYYDLLERGRQLQDTGEEGAAPPPPSSCNGAQQGLRALQQRWDCVRAKLNDRKAKLEEAVSSATEFHNSLQEFIVWLTAAERAIGTATAPSLVLDTALFQVDEHKIFVTELNGRREALVELERAGAQLKLAAPKQDGALIRNLLLSVSARWDKVAQRSLERSRALEDARKRAKQFHESWSGLMGWLEEAERNLDTELDIANDPGKIKCQLSKHKEFQRALGGKQPSYDGTARGGRLMRERATQEDDKQRLDDMLSELRDRWDTVCGKSVERQNKLEEALLFSGQFADALQALVDWLYRVEPQLAEDQPVHGDLDLVLNLIDSHKVFQKELGKRSGGVAALRRSARDLAESSRDDATWVKVQMAELGARWDSVCRLSVTKQARLEVALKQAEEFHAAVHSLLEWLAEAEQTLRFHGTLPDDEEALCTLIETHKEFMKKLEERLAELNRATAMGEAILGLSHPDAVTTIKHWLTIIRARFEEVMAWAKQHQQRLETFLEELLQNAQLMDGLLSWLQRAEETLAGREAQPVPQDLDQVKTLIAEHQAFMEEMTQKQPDVDKLTKTFKRKQPTEAHSHIPTLDRTRGKKRVGMAGPSPGPTLGPSPLDAQNPRVNLLFNKWRQVWLMAWDRQRKLQDELDRLTELKEFASFDFDVWRKRYMRWMNHKKSRVMDFFRRIDKDQDGRITRQEFMEGILSSKFPTNRLEMSAVADVFDQDGDGCMDYYEFVAALHPNKDAYRPLTDADKIEDEVTRQVSKCRCPKRFQVEQIGDNKYRFFLGNQFGDSQQLRLVRILRSTVMVRVGGGWMALDEFLVKNDPCRVHHYGSRMIRSDIVGPVSSPAAIAKGRTNLELRERFILAEGVSQALAPFRPKGRRSRPDSRGASPTRSNSSPSNHSTSPANHQQQAGSAGGPGGSAPTSPPPHTASTTTRKSGATTTTSSNNNNHGETGSNTGRSTNGNKNTPVHSSRLKQPGFLTDSRKLQSSRPSSRTGSQAGSRPGSRQGSRAGSCTSSRRGSDASDLDVSDLTSLCSDASELQPQLRPQQQQQPHAGATAAGPGGLLRSSGSGSPVRPLRTGGRSSSAAALKPSKIPTPSKMKQPTPVRGGTAKR